MTPANVAKIDSVTPGTEVEQLGEITQSWNNMTTIETLLAGSIALIEKGVEDYCAAGSEDKLFVQGISLIEEAVRQVCATRVFLYDGMIQEFRDGEKQAAEALQSGTRAGSAA